MLVVTGVPIYPGNNDILTPKAEASTNMRIEPSEINVSKGEKANILFSFNAADGNQEEHDIVIMVCTPQLNGAAPIPGEVITEGTFKTKENNQYITHKVEWDGTINGEPLAEGRYTICVAPANYTGQGVYYGQMASFEIIESEWLDAPEAVSVKPATAAGRVTVSGTAPVGTTVKLELTETGKEEAEQLGTATTNGQGSWSQVVAIPANKLVSLSAQAKEGELTSSYSELVNVMRYELPAFPITWEALAAYFYKTDSMASTVQQAKQIAEWNNVSITACSEAACSERISNVSSLVLIDPEMEAAPAQADLAAFQADDIQDRLRIVNPSGAEPIDLARGDFVYYAPSLYLQALMPLDFSLQYMSRNAEEGAHGLGWRHSYEWSLAAIDNKIELIEPDGSRFEFIPLSGGKYMSPRGTSLSLERLSSGAYVVRTLEGLTYTFGTQGLLQSIADLNGNTIQLAYSGQQLQSVTTLGASLTLAYNEEGRLISAADQTGRKLQYHYSAAGDLIEIVDVDESTIDLTYDDKHRVTSVTTPEKDGTMSVVYDDEGRVTSLTDYYGEQSETSYEGKIAPVVRGEDEEVPGPEGPISIHPDNARDIAESDEVILSGTMHNLANAPAYRTVNGLNPVIANYIESQTNKFKQDIATFNSSAIACNSCDMAGISSAIQNSNANPVVIKAGQLNVEDSVTFGSASKPVVVIADGMNTNKDITVEIYGTLVVQNGLNANTKLKLIAHEVGGKYGSILSNGRIHLNNDSTVKVDHTLFTAGLTYNSGLLTIDADRIVVTDELHINTRVQMNIASEMSLGGLVSNNELAELTITGGDLFVRDNVSVNNQLAISTGGVFAIGGDMTPNRKPAVTTGVGAGKTILKYPATEVAARSTEGTINGVSAVSSSEEWQLAGVASSVAPAGQTVQKDALGRETSYAWSDRFLLKSKKLPDGTTNEFEYDNGNRVKRIVDGKKNTNRMKYDARGNLLQAIGGHGQAIVYRYNRLNRVVAVIDSQGSKESYQYDDAGNVTKQTDPLGNISTVEYDSAGVPTKTVDAEGAETTYVNDSNKFPSVVVDSAGYETTVERDALHRITKMDDGQGTVEEYVYDTKDRIVSATDSLGQHTAVEFDLNGNLKSATDEAGGTEQYTYHVDRLMSEKDAVGNETSYAYDAVGNIKSTTDADGAVTTESVDSMDRVKTTTDALGHVTTYTYDDSGNVLSVTDPEGGITRNTYNKDNQLLTVTDPLGAVTTNKYDSEGQLIKTTNAIGNSTWYEYDDAGQMIKMIDALGGETEYSYDGNGNLISTILPNGAEWKTKYDERGFDVGQIDPLSNETTIERDLQGRMTASIDAEGNKTSYEYDELGRNTKITNALGNATSYQYDALGNVVSVTDANGFETSFEYDANSRLVTVTNAEGDITSYTYNETGQVVEQLNANGHATTYEYNGLGQLTKRINPLGEEKSYEYDAKGNLNKVIEPDGVTTTFTYDAAGRVVLTSYSSGAKVEYTYDLVGRRLEMLDSNGLTRYTSDALNRPTEIIDAHGYNIRYEWDSVGNRSRVIYPDNSSVRYSYDELNRITEVRDNQQQPTIYSYDKNSRLKQKTLPNQGKSVYQYDALGQLLELAHYGPDTQLVEKLTYSYDAAGNMLSEARQEAGSDEDNVTGAAKPAEVTQYAYDALNQLVEAQKLGGTKSNYSYDAFGNRTSKTIVENGSWTEETYTYDAANKLTLWQSGSDTRSYSYDLRGNLLQVQGTGSGARTMEQLLQLQDPAESLEEDLSTSEDANESNRSELEEAEASDTQDVVEHTGEETEDDTASETAESDVQATEDLEVVHEELEGSSELDNQASDEEVDEQVSAEENEAQAEQELPSDLLNSLNASNGLLEQYVWNDANRLVRHTNETGDITSYRYDGDHNRVYMGTELGSLDTANAYPDSHPLGDRIGWEPQYKKEQTAIYFANDTTLSYVEPLMAISEDTNWKQNYTYGALGERISMSYLPSGDASNAWEPTPGASGANSGNVLTTLYYLSDVRGSALGLMDPEGAIAARYHYDEFGTALEDEKFDLKWAGPDNLFGYTGLGYDYSSGLNYARDRYFDANLGRFISEDTVEGDYKNPLSLNLYTYVQNNPNKYVDPSGNIPVLIAILGKALVNYAIDVMIGVGMDYLSYVQSGSSSKFNMTASLKKNAKESAVPGLGFVKKVSRALKLADDIKKAQKAAKAKLFKWGNPKSTPTYGHTFSEHGSKKKPNQLIDRAKALKHQVGQWLDEKSAADFLSKVAKKGPGVHEVPLPSSIRSRSYLPDGKEVKADSARVVVKADGGIKTAFPYNKSYSSGKGK